MKCPVDGETLQMMERSGVEIDYCPTCRGVWLDRGELDKILERSAPTTSPSTPTRTSHSSPWHDYDGERGERGYSDSSPRRRKKKDSLLSDLFDF